ncbi:hypothetical protein JOD67_007315 [Tenggerimyces flavus]|nr:hypothetical protein [Tenggerimyces flavus]
MKGTFIQTYWMKVPFIQTADSSGRRGWRGRGAERAGGVAEV